jgi:tRNA 2-thiouridine synthesizing protein A
VGRVYAARVPSEEILVDARGHRCPVPTLRLRRALEAAPEGARVRLLADDPLARLDVPHFAAEAGAEVLEVTETERGLAFVLAKPPKP